MYGFRRGSGGAGGAGNVSTLSGGANGRITLWNGPTTVTGDASGTWSGTGHTFVLGSPTFNASDGHFTGPAGASFGPSSVGGGFTNQPAGDTIALISDNAGDTTQQVTIIGTLAGVDASENIMLNGVVPVVSAGTYDLILALVLNSACAGTVTAKDMAALTITTIAPAALSAGLQTFAAIDGYGKVLQIVASGATTKTVGIGGYALGGGIQREPVVLTGTTKVNTTNTWEGAVQFYLGDLEVTRTVTLNSIAGFDFRSVAGVLEPVEAGSFAARNLANAAVAYETTQSSAPTYNFAWLGVTADPDAADFGLIQDGTPYFTGTNDSARDNTMILGYNPGSQNTPPITTEPSLTWTIESHYVNNTPAPDTHWLESYWQYVKPAASSGATFRPLTLNVDRVTTASIFAINSDKTIFQDAIAANVYMGIQPSSNQVYVGASTTLDATVNNTQFVRQKNAAGTGYVNIGWVDTAGFVTLGGGTGYAGISVQMGAYGGLSLPAGTTATYHYPMSFTSGPLNTTATAGAMEYLAPDFYLTPTGTERGAVALVTTGTSAPATTPTAVGRMFVDTAAGKVYVSTGTASSGDWKILN